MEVNYLLNSNVIVAYLDNKLPPRGMDFLSDIVDRIPNISVISQIEVLRYNTTSDVMKILSDFIDCSVILPLDTKVVKSTISLCRQSKIKLPDAIIAATSIVYNFTLLTRNVDDFKNIHGLIYENPWDK
ncbi:motility twitching protein PilT [Spirochaetia bacterium]|nr:motility twitching protein PilT [Spirochaetia bacterium]